MGHKYMVDKMPADAFALRCLTSSFATNIVMPLSKSACVNRRFSSDTVEQNMRRPCAIFARDSSVSMSRP